MVVWEEQSRIHANGIVVAPESGNAQSDPGVARLDDSFFVVWLEDVHAYGRVIFDGRTLGPITDLGAAYQPPSVAADVEGFVVVLQQTQGIDQVSQAIARMERVTQTTAATAEESAAASEELNAQAERSMSVVRQLEAMVVRGPGARADTGTAFGAPLRAPVNGTPPRVVTIRQKPSMKSTVTRRSAEDELPMGDTGTYAKF